MPRSGRLQRPSDFTGSTLNSFRQVFLRHGLPGALLALLGFFLVSPDTVSAAFSRPYANPTVYLVGALVVFFGLSSYVVWLDRRCDLAQLGWVLYLGALSFWEEWLFRLVLPFTAADWGVPLLAATFVSNLLFGLVHYFTLRWRWQWCLLAFLGGLALSRHMTTHFDLLLITCFHWIGTLINTPRAPGNNER